MHTEQTTDGNWRKILFVVDKKGIIMQVPCCHMCAMRMKVLHCFLCCVKQYEVAKCITAFKFIYYIILLCECLCIIWVLNGTAVLQNA